MATSTGPGVHASPVQGGASRRRFICLRGGGGGTLAEDVGLPETDPAVRLEGGYRAHRAAVDEEGAVPLDALSTSGQAACTTSRRCSMIGWANAEALRR